MRFVSATALMCAAVSVALLGLRVDGYRRAPADCPAFKVFLRAAPPSDKIGG